MMKSGQNLSKATKVQAEVNAKIVNENLYATPNEAAYEFIEDDILNAELILPLSSQGQQLYDEIWERFTTAP